MDLTNYSAALTVKDTDSGAYTTPAATPLLSLTSPSGGITLGGTAGTLTVVQTATQTSAYTWASGDYRLTLTAGSGGDTDVYLYGSVTVERF